MKLLLLQIQENVIATSYRCKFTFCAFRGIHARCIVRAQTSRVCFSRRTCTTHCSSLCARHIPSFSRDFIRKWEGSFSFTLTSTAGKWVELVNFKITVKRLHLVTVRRVTAFNQGFMSHPLAYLARRNYEMNLLFVFAFIHKDFMQGVISGFSPLCSIIV